MIAHQLIDFLCKQDDVDLVELDQRKHEGLLNELRELVANTQRPLSRSDAIRIRPQIKFGIVVAKPKEEALA